VLVSGTNGKTPYTIIATINFSLHKDIPMIFVEDKVDKISKANYGSFGIGLERANIWKAGYLEASQKLYSEEDLRAAAIFAQNIDLTSLTNKEKEIAINAFIQSLNQECIELEMEGFKVNGMVDEATSYRIKTNRDENGQLIAYLKQ